MENSVLGNALEGVPEEEEEEKPKDSNIESTKNIDGEEDKLSVLTHLSFLGSFLCSNFSKGHS